MTSITISCDAYPPFKGSHGSDLGITDGIIVARHRPRRHSNRPASEFGSSRLARAGRRTWQSRFASSNVHVLQFEHAHGFNTCGLLLGPPGTNALCATDARRIDRRHVACDDRRATSGSTGILPLPTPIRASKTVRRALVDYVAAFPSIPGVGKRRPSTRMSFSIVSTFTGMGGIRTSRHSSVPLYDVRAEADADGSTSPACGRSRSAYRSAPIRMERETPRIVHRIALRFNRHLRSVRTTLRNVRER